MTISSFLLKPTDISLRVFSLVQLYQAIYLRGDIFDTGFAGRVLPGVSPESARVAVQKWFQRPMMRLDDNPVNVHYYSAIPLAIAPKLQQSPAAIGDWIKQAVIFDAKRLLATTNPPHAVCLQVELRITEAGWLEWRWGTAALEIWLAHAARSLLILPLPPVKPSATWRTSDELWRCLYTYTRCQALLSRNFAGTTMPFSGALDPIVGRVLVKLMQVIDNLVDLPFPPEADSYVRALNTTVKAFEELECAYLDRSEAACPSLRLGLVILIKSLLTQLIQGAFGIKLAEKI
ncbi:MAG: hypothetical protein HC805_00575 [Alkalinema sp. RL_2_19]|nr:hypothetical protein [Alkalinema sp. RL_2_19]